MHNRYFTPSPVLCKPTSGTLARSLDILHVAAAMVRGMRDFITGDKRQEALALKSGLTVHMIE